MHHYGGLGQRQLLGNNPIKYTDPTGEAVETIWDIGLTIHDIFSAISKSIKGDHSGWGDVALDAASILIPGVPAGLSKVDDVVKIGNKVENVTDAVNTIEKIADTTKSIDKFQDTLNTIKKTGKAPAGYQSGKVFKNRGGDGYQVLPKIDKNGNPITYTEWDVNPKVAGQSRGTERLVIGSDGSAWKTTDHYHTFSQME